MAEVTSVKVTPPPTVVPAPVPVPVRPILEYGHAQRWERLKPLIRPVNLMFAVGAIMFLSSARTGRTPFPVAAAAALLASGLTYFYARARLERPRTTLWLPTDQLLLAAVLAMGGVFNVLGRATLVSNSVYWLPENQTYPFKPAWALQPLWLTAVGVAWFVVAALVIERRSGRIAAVACPPPGEPE